MIRVSSAFSMLCPQGTTEWQCGQKKKCQPRSGPGMCMPRAVKPGLCPCTPFILPASWPLLQAATVWETFRKHLISFYGSLSEQMLNPETFLAHPRLKTGFVKQFTWARPAPFSASQLFGWLTLPSSSPLGQKAANPAAAAAKMVMITISGICPSSLPTKTVGSKSNLMVNNQYLLPQGHQKEREVSRAKIIFTCMKVSLPSDL